MRLRSEKQISPRGRGTVAARAMVSRHQTEQSGKDFRNAEQLDRDLASRWRARIASQPLCPRETRVGTLRAGKKHIRLAW